MRNYGAYHHPCSLLLGNHMYISANIGGKIESRPYTPITSDDELGYFELVIKVSLPTGLCTIFAMKLNLSGETRFD